VYFSSVNFAEIPCIVGSPALRIHLCADEVVVITIDPKTGRITLRDSGDLAAAGRGPRFTAVSTKINENPTVLFNAIVHLRFMVSPQLFHDQLSSASFPPDYCRTRGPESQVPWSPELSNAQFLARRYSNILVTRVPIDISSYGRNNQTWPRYTRFCLHPTSQFPRSLSRSHHY